MIIKLQDCPQFAKKLFLKSYLSLGPLPPTLATSFD